MRGCFGFKGVDGGGSGSNPLGNNFNPTAKGLALNYFLGAIFERTYLAIGVTSTHRRRRYPVGLLILYVVSFLRPWAVVHNIDYIQ